MVQTQVLMNYIYMHATNFNFGSYSDTSNVYKRF